MFCTNNKRKENTEVAVIDALLLMMVHITDYNRHRHRIGACSNAMSKFPEIITFHSALIFSELTEMLPSNE